MEVSTEPLALPCARFLCNLEMGSGQCLQSWLPPDVGEYQCFTRRNRVCCSIAGTAKVAAVQMWAYLWVGRGEERKDKTLKLVTGWWVCLNYMSFNFVVCRIHLLWAKKKKEWSTAEENMRFYSSEVTEVSKHIYTISKTHSTTECVQKIPRCKMSTWMVLCWSTGGQWGEGQLGLGKRFQPRCTSDREGI